MVFTKQKNSRDDCQKNIKAQIAKQLLFAIPKMALHKNLSRRHPLRMKPIFSVMVHFKNNKDNNLCNPVQNLFKIRLPIFTRITEQNTIY